MGEREAFDWVVRGAGACVVYATSGFLGGYDVGQRGGGEGPKFEGTGEADQVLDLQGDSRVDSQWD